MRRFYKGFSLFFLVPIFPYSVAYASDNQVPSLYTYQMDGRTPFIQEIDAVKESLKIAAYRIDDQIILEAILRAHDRGVDVQIILETETYAHENSGASNYSSLKVLKEKGIEVFGRPDWIQQTHHKITILDDQKALLTTGNFDAPSFDGSGDFTGTRDFTVLITDSGMVNEIRQVFTNDTKNIRTKRTNPNLLWGPKEQREKFLSFLDQAQREILIYQQDIQDSEICEMLLKKLKVGVDVKVVMIPFPFSKTKDNNFENQMRLKNAGAEVRFGSLGFAVENQIGLNPLVWLRKEYPDMSRKAL